MLRSGRNGRAPRWWALYLGSILLAGCGAAPRLTAFSQWSVAQREPPPPVADPSRTYLRARLARGTAYLVLGYRDSKAEGDTDVYYSADGEVVKLRSGRLVGTAGLPLDWREVRHGNVPAWSALVASQDAAAPVVYSRERDEMPGHRFGIRDVVSVRAIPPGPLAPTEAGLRWFEEVSTPLSATTPPLPASRFAVLTSAAGSQVVYSEQCLSPTVCLTLEAWPVSAALAAAPTAAGRRH